VQAQAVAGVLEFHVAVVAVRVTGIGVQCSHSEVEQSFICTLWEESSLMQSLPELSPMSHEWKISPSVLTGKDQSGGQFPRWAGEEVTPSPGPVGTPIRRPRPPSRRPALASGGRISELLG
jgi:hypothetical protein